MKKEITDFIKKVCERYKFEAYYMPDNDCYVVTKKGRAVQNFNTEQFYQIPRAQRMKEYIPLVMGLSHNLGEKTKEQIFLPRNFGIKIV